MSITIIVPEREGGSVADISAAVETCEAAAALVAPILDYTADITALAPLTTELAALGPIADDIVTVAGISADVTAVAADATDIGTVATNIANVNTVAGVSGDVTTVAGIAANVTTVAGISANVTTVAGVAASIQTVAGVSADVTTVAGISANVTTVAGVSADVTAVAAVAADVTSVAAIDSDVTTVATNMADVQNAAALIDQLAGRDLLSALPQNPVGVWPYSLYDATYKAIPNIVRPDVALEQNLILPTSRLFGSAASGAVFWTKTSATCVDDAAVGQSGATDASSLSGTAGWKMMLASTSGQYFPAGQYTLGCYAKRNTGTDQDFAFTADNATTRSVKTATSTWQWFTYTVTLGVAKFGSNFGLVDSTGATPAELLISDFVVYSGASAPEPQEKVGHAYFGKNLIKTSIPTAVDISGGVMTSFPGVAFFEEGFTAGAYTAVAVIERTADTHTVNPFLGRLRGVTTWGPGTPRGTPSTGGPVHPAGLANFVNQIPGATLGTTQTRKMFEMINEGPHFVWWRSDGTNTEYGVDDVSMGFDKNTWTSRVIRDLWINGYTTTAISQHKASAYSALWDRCLTNAEIEQAYFAAKTEAIRGASINLTGDRLNRIIAFEGDSISSLATTGYNSLYCDTTTKPFFGSTWAVGGSTLATMISRSDYVDAMLPTNKYGRKFILTWMIGANDLMSPTFLTGYPGDVAEYITTLKAWSLARATAGWTVVPITTLPKSDATPATAVTYDTRRTTLNADIIANLSAYGATTYVPFGEHPQMGIYDSYGTHPTMWSDRTHPSNLGHSTYLEPTYRAVIDAL